MSAGSAISVLIPALNEEGNVSGTVDRVVNSLRGRVADYEIILVNDGSSDGTGDEIDALAECSTRIRAFHNTRSKGLGAVYSCALKTAGKDYFVYIPGDNTWPEGSLGLLFAHFCKADVVTIYADNPEARTIGRRIASKTYTRLVNLLFGYRMPYYNGLTIYPTCFLRKIEIGTSGFGFQAEVLLKALDEGLSCQAIPAAIDVRAQGRSKAVSFKNIVSVQATLLRLFWSLRVRKK